LDAVKEGRARRTSSARARLALAGVAALAGLAALAATSAGAQSAEPAAAPVTSAAVTRVEARSAQLLAVGTVHGERMTIHLSRLDDNAPLRNAEVVLVLRGATHPATALADGGYAVATPDLALPGAAAVRIEVTAGGTRQDLEGTLQPAAATGAATEDKGSSRQLGWWVLNFAVCIGFLWLWQRRKRHDPDAGPQS